MTSAQSDVRSLLDVRALLEERVKACRAKDIDWLMSLYSPHIVYFDCVPPLQGFSGSSAVRKNFIRWFKEYRGSIGLETEELRIVANDDIAFAHMLHLDTGNVHLMKSDREGAWVRSTVCCQRSAGKWLITHEHVSWPFEFNKESGGVVMTRSR